MGNELEAILEKERPQQPSRRFYQPFLQIHNQCGICFQPGLRRYKYFGMWGDKDKDKASCQRIAQSWVGLAQQIAFVFNLICEDKRSVECGEKTVLGGLIL